MAENKTIRVVTSDGSGTIHEAHNHLADKWRTTDDGWIDLLADDGYPVATYAARSVVSLRYVDAAPERAARTMDDGTDAGGYIIPPTHPAAARP